MSREQWLEVLLRLLLRQPNNKLWRESAEALLAGDW